MVERSALVAVALVAASIGAAAGENPFALALGQVDPIPFPTAACPEAMPRIGGKARIELVWIDVARTAPWAFPGAAREVAALLDRMDVRGLLRRADVLEEVAESEVMVVLLPEPPARARIPGAAMGASISSAEAPRSVWIYASAVARTLGLPWPSEGWSIRDRRDFRVALGRVCVHELVHAITRDPTHARRGLMVARLDRARLVDAVPPPIAHATAVAFRSALGPSSPPRMAGSAGAVGTPAAAEGSRSGEAPKAGAGPVVASRASWRR